MSYAIVTGLLVGLYAGLMTGAFAARLADATDLDTVRSDLGATVNQALAPAHVSLWLSR